MDTPFVVGSLVLGCAACVLGQESTADAPRPAKRAHHALAFDATRGEVVLYGGSTAAENDASTFFDDLWTWDGRRWQRLASTKVPRSSHELIYDSGRKRLLAIGGLSDKGPHRELRVFDGSTWTLLGSHPALGLIDSSVAYDAHRERLVLFGGQRADGTVSGETWEFDGEQWRQVATTGPGPLCSALMVFDEARGVALLFSGRNDKRALSSETWEWDGTEWSRVATAGPPARFAAGFAFDAKRQQAVLFGGGNSGGRLADTWLWDGKEWQDAKVTGPSGRYMPKMAFDERRSVVVLFGGRIKYPEDSNETWEWDGKQWSRIE